MGEVKRALISVSEKSGVAGFAKRLAAQGVEIISTGGTAGLLRESGVSVTAVSDYTGFPEIMDGRVKTLHPAIHGGLLGRRDLPGHVRAMEENNIKPIDMVVVNLYPFKKTISNPASTFDDAIENIDIGGPAMIRSASKNFRDVVVLVDPEDYESVLLEMESGEVSEKTRLRLAKKAFTHTAEYDTLISSYLRKKSGCECGCDNLFGSGVKKIADLRYGENPHQRASFYRDENSRGGVADSLQLHGKELSYNNILDLSAVVDLVSEFKEPASVVVKHTNPCGAATDTSLVKAYIDARETDPLSAFGGIVGFNRKVDLETAMELSATFLEVVVAPDFDADALQKLKEKKNIRLMKMDIPVLNDSKRYDIRSVSGGVLYQEKDIELLDEKALKVVTRVAPTDSQMAALMFAWRVAKHVKSNAIIFAEENRLVAVGAGQMSRVDSSMVAISKAKRPVKGASMASDAFFPFRDAVDSAAKAGVAAIIQPGGSIRDQEVIDAADEHGIAMVFTGMRHFKH